MSARLGEFDSRPAGTRLRFGGVVAVSGGMDARAWLDENWSAPKPGLSKEEAIEALCDRVHTVRFCRDGWIVTDVTVEVCEIPSWGTQWFREWGGPSEEGYL